MEMNRIKVKKKGIKDMKWKLIFLTAALWLMGSSVALAQDPPDPPVTNYTVTVVDSIIGSTAYGGGTVTGAGSYASGATATLNVTSVADGYQFVGWSDGNNDNHRDVTVTSDTTFYALFFKSGITILGSVFGGGEGATATVQTNTSVSITSGLVETNLYGGGALGKVNGNSSVEVIGGEVGVMDYTANAATHTHGNLTDGGFGGHVFGGGKGSTTNFDDGRVKGNASVTMSGGHVYFNVYGGGEMGSVGEREITYATPNDPTSTVVSTTAVANTGLASVTVTGGQVGPAPTTSLPIALNGENGYVFGGGKGKGDDPMNQWKLFADVNNTSVTINIPSNADPTENRIWGSVFGGAEDGHVLGDAHVYYRNGLTGTDGTTSYDGNIFGGGRNYSRKYYTAGRVQGNVYVEMSGGQIYGSIFGAGRLAMTGCGVNGFSVRNDGRYAAMLEGDDHGQVTIQVQGGTVGNEALITGFTTHSMGDVFGGGKGDMRGIDVTGHPAESPLLVSLCKNTDVQISGTARILGSVFGGGEVANVGNYTWEMPNATTIKNIGISSDGLCKVTVSGGTIGVDDMQMNCEIAGTAGDHNYNLKYNYDIGHVFGGGEGLALDPDSYPTVNPGNQGHNNESIINLIATVNTTEVTISGSAFVKGSVYGGAENGHVLGDTDVKVDGGQIGCGIGTNNPYDPNDFLSPLEAEVTTANALAECPHWPYDKNTNRPFDPIRIKDFNETPTDGKTYFGNVFGGGSGYYPYIKEITQNNQTTYETRWNPKSGIVEGDTRVEITNGHILTSVYGGCETTDVLGDATVIMSGGTLGVPRTNDQMTDHPVTCYLFGAGKGDPRTDFNTWTNVANTNVQVSGGTIYGSAFGGGEEGHVLGDVTMTIGQASGKTTIIGTSGTSTVDGNIFGGGRGFSGTALTAGVVAGNVNLSITGGTMLGSVYGGGRLASVGTHLVASSDPNYGKMQADVTDPNNSSNNESHGHITVNISGGTIGNDKEAMFQTNAHNIGGNVYGGSKGGLTLLNGDVNPNWPYLAKVKDTRVTISQTSAQGTTIKGNVYGGSELGFVTTDSTDPDVMSKDSTAVTVTGGTIWGSVFGGSYGSDNTTLTTDYTFSLPNVTDPITVVTSPLKLAGRVFGNTKVKIKGGWIKTNVYGGGEFASAGTLTGATAHTSTDDFYLSWPYEFTYVDGTGSSEVKVTGGRIGITGKDFMGPWIKVGNEYKPAKLDQGVLVEITDPNEIKDARKDNGDVYGAGKGTAGETDTYAHLANVNKTKVTVDYTNNTATPQTYKPYNVDYVSSFYKNMEDWTNYGTLGCITGALYGGGENGHVNEDTDVTLSDGLVGHAIYGGGKGKDKYKDNQNQEVYNLTAGKVYGNTNILVEGGYVVRSVFGGGNTASVGKGNYIGFGETGTADNSGKCTVNITGGTLGMLPIDTNEPDDVIKDNIPYGSVFGGCRGLVEAGSDDENSIKSMLSFVNNTEVNIGGSTGNGPTLLGSVYGGGQDGHVRHSTVVNIDRGVIGVAYTDASTASATVGSNDLNALYWTARGNVFGGGSGVSTYKDANNGNAVTYSKYAGSVLETTTVNINGGTIHRNVYGGGSLAYVYNNLTSGNTSPSNTPSTTINVKGSVGVASDVNGSNFTYGGHVFGASRGITAVDMEEFSYVTNTEVNILTGADVQGNVYGGGELGQVKQSTDVNINTVDGNNGIVRGNVFGSGKGNDTNNGFACVKVNTDVEMKGGQVFGSVYGGGEVASVGTYSDNGSGNIVCADGTGTATVTVTGGTVGSDALYCETNATYPTVASYYNHNEPAITDKGHVFGGGKGESDNTHNHLCDVNTTQVTIGTSNGAATDLRIYGSVYGGAADGHVLGNTNIDFHSGTIGNYGLSSWDGHIFGGGQGSGIKVDNNTDFELYSHCGRVGGNPTINMDGGTLLGSIYGGGRLALTGVNQNGVYNGDNTKGKVTINVSGGTLGNHVGDGHDLLESDFSVGDIFGSGRGDVDYYESIIAGCVTNVEINVSGNPTIYGSVFGGGEMAGLGYRDSNNLFVTGTGHAEITIEDEPVIGTAYEYTVGKDNNPGQWTIYDADGVLTHTCTGNVFGGSQGDVDVSSPHFVSMSSSHSAKVTINGGTIMSAVFGGPEQGTMTGDAEVVIDQTDDTKPILIGTLVNSGANQYYFGQVFGGGYGSDDPADNLTTYIPDPSTPNVTAAVVHDSIAARTALGLPWTADYMSGRVYGDVSVKLLGGTIQGDVFGGGGLAYVGYEPSHTKGNVTLNIGDVNPSNSNDTIGAVTILGNVYGANNLLGSPLGNINLNIFKTAHTDGTGGTVNNTTSGTAYAIHQVFGGGNLAHYTPTPVNSRTTTNGTTTVHVYNCYNTIEEIYGGGNSANVGTTGTSGIPADTRLIIDGGRFNQVFGGGNGPTSTPANIYGTAYTNIYGGTINQLFGGSNLNGSITETNMLVDDSQSACSSNINEIYGGSNQGDIAGDVTTTIACGDGTYDILYGGALNANISGNVTLHVYGNTIGSLYGGSWGKDRAANIDGNVNLNIFGGTITTAFGGNNANGNVGGVITVNVLDYGDNACPLDITDLYGGCNQATHNTTVNSSPIKDSPVVNVMHLKDEHSIHGNVYGGSLGASAVVTGNPTVNIGYDASNSYLSTTLTGLVPTTWTQPTDFRAVIGGNANAGNVYGGGDAAAITGNTTINIRNSNTQVLGNVYAAGKGSNTDKDVAKITGNTNLNVYDGLVNGSIFGGGAIATITGKATVTMEGGTIGHDAENTPKTGNVYGGGQGLAEIDDVTWTNVNETEVNINGGHAFGSVFGGGENGHVVTNTQVNMTAGAIGGHYDNNTLVVCENRYHGNVYGGGRGIDETSSGYIASAGKVSGNTNIHISGGTVYRNVYGGGSMASVGSVDNNNVPVANTGKATILIDGGQIGIDGGYNNGTYSYAKENGHVFGSGRGMAGSGYSHLANVNTTEVTIEGRAYVTGSVFGSGENGHVKGDTKVTVNAADPVVYFDNEGTVDDNIEPYPVIGYPLTAAEMVENVDNPVLVYRGNVYGGGRGIDHVNNGTELSKTAGVVYGNTEVIIHGGTIRHEVFGGGSMASVGTLTYDPTTGAVTGIADGSGLAKVTIDGGIIGMSPELTVTKIMNGTDLISTRSGSNNGLVFGSGRGAAGTLYKDLAFVDTTYVHINGGLVCGAVFGGGNNGHVKRGTRVDITNGTIGSPLTTTEMVEHNPGSNEANQIIYRGNVYGGGRGIDHDAMSHNLSATAGKVYGNTTVNVSGGKVYHDVFGGGSLANVGVEDDDDTGHTYVTISGTAKIGMSPEDAQTAGNIECTGLNNGYVYGSGRGEAGTAYADHAYVKYTHVTVTGDSKIYGAVFGGGANGHVRKDTEIIIDGGEIGNNNSNVSQGITALYRGNVYGGGRGIDTDDNNIVSPTAGWVKGNTSISIEGGKIFHNVYGGGSLATVGEFTTDPTTGVVTGWTSGGTTTIDITGGEIGIDGDGNGLVFGAGRGMAGNTTIGTQTIDFSHLTFVKETNVNVKPGAIVKGSVYGSGDNGHTWTDTHVTMTGGTIGTDGSEMDGNIFGGGRGQDTYGNGSMSATAGKVFGDTYVNMSAGQIKANAYGGGNVSSVAGTTHVTIEGTAQVGASSYPEGGNVFGACRGGASFSHTYATVSNTVVEVNDATVTVQNNVYGGGQMGWVSETTDVTIDGAIVQDVYGAGMGVLHTPPTVGANDDVGISTLVTLEDGTVNGSIYGGGQNGSVGFDAPSGVTATSTVNINGGTVIESVYGGGQMGFTQGNTFVNMSGGEVQNHVFGGAYGTVDQVYVKGYHMVNMRGGLVKGNVYGGSFNGDDALNDFYASSAFSSYTGTEQVCVVNYSGGHTEHHVFGSGYRGRTYGSSYVFVGTNAIMNAPYHMDHSTAPYDQAFYDAHEDLVIDRDVWAGADYGDYDPNVNTEFGSYTVTGRSDIYIDGLGYDTENGTSLGANNFMILRNSVFGCGTLNDGGHQGKRIMVRNYGHATASASGGTDAEPWADATRTLHSIQYADSVIIESSHIHFEGRGIVEDFGTTEKYAIYSVFNDTRLVNGSSLFIDKPIKNISNLHSNVCADVYAATPTYTEVGYADLNPSYFNNPSSVAGKDNKIRINKGTFVSVTQFDAANNRFDYGALKGFMFLMTDGPYNAFAYARPKQSMEAGNIISQGEIQHAYNFDGGFVSYQPAMNIYDADGSLISGGNSIQMRYENHTPNQSKDYQYDQYFRVWRFKATNAQSTFDVVLHATAVLDGSGNPINGFSYYNTTLELPAQQGTNSYYRIKNNTGAAVINYGTELKMVTAGMQEAGTNPRWMYYYKDSNDVESFVYNNAESGVPSDQLTFMHDYPNNAFGLTVIPKGGFLGGSNNTNKPWLLCQEANNPLVASRWNNVDASQTPQIEFLLTHSDKIDGNFTWDPLSVTLEQVKVENGQEVVTDEVTVNVTITTSTRLEQTNKLNTYAIMTHPQGTGNSQDVFKARVLIPSYQLAVTGQYSTWTLTNVEWEPATGFNDNTFVSGQPILNTTARPTKNFVGMTMSPALNFDNVNGWWSMLNSNVDLKSNYGNCNVELGVTDAVNPVSFDFDLLFDGNQKIPESDNAFMGTVKVTAHVTNYKHGDSNNNFGQDVHFEIKVFRRGKGKGFYIDGVDGNFVYSGTRPNAAQPSLAGILYFAKDYEPVDSIYVVNKITANSVETLDWRTPFTPIRVFRYNGGHPLFVPANATDNTPYYTGYGSNPLHDHNQAYKGALIDVVTSMSISSAIIDGAYELDEKDGNNNIVTPDHVYAEAPLINILNGGTLTIEGSDDQMLLHHNFNGNGNGGAINIETNGTLKMNRHSFVENNYVKDGDTEEHHGGGIYMAHYANMLVSDDVMVQDNSHLSYSGTSVDENVYISGYNTVISVGTMEDNDSYGPLNATARIGVTKTDWDGKEYMPVIYAENFAHVNNLYNGNIIFDQMHKYMPYDYPERLPNNDPDYLNKLYWVKTWVTEVASAPTNFNAQNINTPEALAWAISLANGYNSQTAAPTTTFKITKDIDMSDYIWVPIGDNTNPYSGTFEGNGHLVTGIHSPFSMESKGMFGNTSGANISNLQAVVDFYQGNAHQLGGIIGSMNGGTLSNCESAGYLESGYNGYGYIGGLVGKTYAGSIIHSSFAVDTLKALSTDMFTGGLVGELTDGNLYNSYSRIVVDNDNLSTKVGGLVGNMSSGNTGTATHVENCYSDVGTQDIPTFAYQIDAGTIDYCYANKSTNYIPATSTNNGTISGHGSYGTVKGRKEIGYMYDDNKVTLAGVGTNNYVPTTTTYEDNHTIVWNGMLCVLNQWVKEKNAVTDQTSPYYGKNFTKWFRPTSEHVNADLPVLGFPKDNAMATLDADGRFLQYGATKYDNTALDTVIYNGLDGLLDAYKDKSSSIFVYDHAVEVKKWPVGDEKVFVNEDAVLLQDASVSESFGNTTVGVTFDNSGTSAVAYNGVSLDYDWHLMSTPLSNAKMGTTYGKAEGNDDELVSNGTYQPHASPNYPDVVYQNDPVDIVSMVDSYFPNGLTMGDHLANTDVRWDFYSYYEPEYHWINLKRNKNNHFHRDAHEGIIDPDPNKPYQLDERDPAGNDYRHYQINYNATDQSATTAGDDDCVFTPGKGYMMAISQDSYMSSTGILNRNVTIPVTTEAPDDISGYASHNRGSNLVGNPYQAYLDLNEVSTTSVNTGLDKFWVYDADHGNGIYVPYYKQASTNPWTPSQYIHPHQGFFVVKTTSGNTDMTFTPSMATTKKDDNSYFRGRPAYPLVNLLVTDEAGSSDLAIVEFNRPEVGGVPKIENLKNASFDLYARFDNESYGLLFTPEGTERVPVFFKTPTSGTYTLSWEKYNGTFSRMRLIDNITGTDYDMLTHDHYTFQAYNTDFAARFYIVFSVTGVDENDDNDSPLAYFNGEGWVVEGEGKLELVDMLGHVLYANNLSGERTIVHFDDFAAGMYMLRLVNSNTILKAQKIVIE